MDLSVMHIAPIFSTVPPIGYGGVERVIDELTATQRSSVPNLRVVVAASSDSRPSVPLVGRHLSIRARPQQLSLADTFEELERHYLWAFDEACRRAVDVVHLHGPWGLEYRPTALPLPAVVSIYDDTRRPDVWEPLLQVPERAFLVANSRSTRDKAPSVLWHDAVLEGLVIDRYPFSEEKDDYCCFVGELVPDKGLDIAIAVARAAGLPLKVIGRPRILDVDADVVAEQERFLQAEFYPWLAGSDVEYLGELGDERLPILARARALLAPARAEEPFGRVSAESMACGTPVVTFARGSAPEIIAQGVSGYYVETEDEMIAVLKDIEQVNPHACRDHARRALNMQRVAFSYAQIYRSVVGCASAEPGAPR